MSSTGTLRLSVIWRFSVSTVAPSGTWMRSNPSLKVMKRVRSSQLFCWCVTIDICLCMSAHLDLSLMSILSERLQSEKISTNLQRGYAFSMLSHVVCGTKSHAFMLLVSLTQLGTSRILTTSHCHISSMRWVNSVFGMVSLDHDIGTVEWTSGKGRTL
jgi:hypothetical protein